MHYSMNNVIDRLEPLLEFKIYLGVQCSLYCSFYIHLYTFLLGYGKICLFIFEIDIAFVKEGLEPMEKNISYSYGMGALLNDEASENDRIGWRIRTARGTRKMSQAELGEKIGLNADRVQQYENGYRKPKRELLEKIADALGISVLALADPNTMNEIGAVYAMFEMESNFSLKIDSVFKDGEKKYCLTAGSNSELYEYMADWYEMSCIHEAELRTLTTDDERLEVDESYWSWKSNFPEVTFDKAARDTKKAEILKRIKDLQEIYNMLEAMDNK